MCENTNSNNSSLQADLPHDQQADEFGPMIYSYSRAQAIEDGVLVDLMASDETLRLVREAGFRLPIAMTSAAFHETITVGTKVEGGNTVYPASQSLAGRLWDVLMVLHFSIRAATRNGNADIVHFKVDVDPRGNGKHKTVSLYCQIGPGDEGEPVLTISLEGED